MEKVKERELLDIIISPKRRWIGHITCDNGLLKKVIGGRIDGRRKKGRKSNGMLSDLTNDSYCLTEVWSKECTNVAKGQLFKGI